MGHAPFVRERRREVESHAVHADAVRAACRHEQERLGASRGGAVHGWRLRPLHLCRGGAPSWVWPLGDAPPAAAGFTAGELSGCANAIETNSDSATCSNQGVTRCGTNAQATR